ncbi:beta-1 adrenergic receptor-like [Oculina patagonica]
MSSTLRTVLFTNISTEPLQRLTTAPTPFLQDVKYLTTSEVVISTLYYACVVFTIFVGNALVISAYQKNWRLQTTTNTFILGLAVADLMVGFVSIPCWFYVYSCHYFDTTLHPVGYELYITLDVFIGCASIFQLTAISIERCIAVVWPIRHRAIHEGVFHAMILIAWCCSALVAGLYPIQLKHWEEGYTVFIFTMCFVGPFIVMFGVYLLIYETAGRSRTRVYPELAAATIHREIRIAGTVALVTGLFMIAWFPFFVVTVVATYDLERLPEPPGLFRLIAFVKALHYTNSALNPILYGYRNPEMRKTMHSVAFACCPLLAMFKRRPSGLQARLNRGGMQAFVPGTMLAVPSLFERRSTPSNGTATTVVAFVNRGGEVESRPASLHESLRELSSAE